jgi:hypothetical protein
MRYRLRTLLIVLAIAPALLAGAWFGGLLVGEAIVRSRPAERQAFVEHVLGATALIVVGTLLVAATRPRP